MEKYLPLILCILTIIVLICSVGYIIWKKERFDFDTEIKPLTPEEISKLSPQQLNEFWSISQPYFSELSYQQQEAFRNVYKF